MKIKTATKQDQADNWGKYYVDLRERAKVAKEKQDEASAAIKLFAASSGEKSGKQTIVVGKEFVVGFTQPDATPAIDTVKLFSLAPKLKKKVMVEVIDDKKLEAALKSGELTNEILSKCLIPGKTPSPRVLVSTVEEHNEALKKAANENS